MNAYINSFGEWSSCVHVHPCRVSEIYSIAVIVIILQHVHRNRRPYAGRVVFDYVVQGFMHVFLYCTFPITFFKRKIHKRPANTKLITITALYGSINWESTLILKNGT